MWPKKPVGSSVWPLAERDGLSGYDGELYGLYVLAEFQRHGVGRALLQVVAQRLTAGGFKAMVIWVLKDNVKARAFYDALGGVLVEEKAITISGAELIDIAYGWPDICTVTSHDEIGFDVRDQKRSEELYP